MVRTALRCGVAFAAALAACSSAGAQTFSNLNPITIPAGAPGTTSGIADPYGSTINVAGLLGPVGKLTVTLTGLTHTNPDDIDAMLVSPSGTALRLMSDCGDGDDVAGIDLTFDDLTLATLPNGSLISTGTYRPTNFGAGDDGFPAPAPAPNAATLSAFNGQDGNGTWTLYVQDDNGGAVGSITSWSVTFLCGIEVTNTNNAGAGSLRGALTLAELNPGLDVICFNIPGAGPHTIALNAGLQMIDQPIIIDGLTQPGTSHDMWPPTLKIVIDGSGAGVNADGLEFNGGASSSIVRGLVIQNFGRHGVFLDGASDCRVQCNYIGTIDNGKAAAANSGDGVRIAGAGGNVVGVDGDGNDDGKERNLISGNVGVGVRLVNSSNCVIAGNWVGISSHGLSAIPNDEGGVLLTAVLVGSSSLNRIGTNGDGLSDELERNIISGNGGNGVGIDVSLLNSSFANLIAGNSIGVGADGVTAVGNAGHGVCIAGPLADENRVGFDQTGSDAPAKGNVIAHNTGIGVAVLGDGILNAAQGNWIRGNSIHSNGGLGIDLAGDGVTLNDDGDSDNGANEFKNFPVITSVVGSLVSGTYNSIANNTYDIDVYQSMVGDPSGYGEGEIYLGSTTVTTDGSGNGNWSLNVVFRSTIYVISATATDRGVARGTSEFGENVDTGVATCILECPDNITVPADPGECSASVEFGPLQEEICIQLGYIVTCSIPDGVGGTIEITSPHTFPIGTTTVTCQSFDPLGQFLDECTFDVTVTDIDGPTVVCPADVTVDNDAGMCSASVSFDIELAFPCSGGGRGLFEIICSINGTEISSPHTFPVGVTTVECCVFDDPPIRGDKGGPAAPLDCCTFTVTVNDTEDPVLECRQNVELSAGECGNVLLTAADLVASFTDNCPIDCCEPEMLDDNSGPCGIWFNELLECPPLNTPIQVGVTGMDCHGNTATCTATVIIRGSDCNNNGVDDACDICSGLSLDCNDNWVPDECECFWCNVSADVLDAKPPPEPDVNAQLSHLGGGTECGEKVADDFYLEPGCVHRISAVRGRLLTNSISQLRRARLELYEDCNGKPLDTPFFTADYTHPSDGAIPSEILDVQPAADGFSVVTYRFDLCDACIWLEGGKTYWVSIIGLTDNIDMVDLSYWLADEADGRIMGNVPVKRSGTPGSTWGSCNFGPWESLEDCCIGCVNMDFCVDGYSCPILWENGKVDLVNRGGSASGGHQQYNNRTADSFVIKTCRDEELCLIEAWIWSNCEPLSGFIELYEDTGCDPRLADEPFRRYVGDEVDAKRFEETLMVGGRTYYLWRLRVKEPDITLAAAHNYWLSAGATSTGNFNTGSLFAWSKYGCDPCSGPDTFRITPAQHRTLRQPATEWADVTPTRDVAFTIAGKGPDVFGDDSSGPPPTGGTPACAADANNDGQVAVDDIFTFLSAWFAGCP